MPTDAATAAEFPLARWATQQLDGLAQASGCPMPGGAQLLGERAALNRFTVPARRSGGGKCHLLATHDGWIALNLARDADRELLPALFGERIEDTADLGEIAELVWAQDAAALVARGREMGLALASADEEPAAPAAQWLLRTPGASAPRSAPLVVDLSALWAGPLCGHLLQGAGAQVIKLESSTRPDAMREGDPAFFALLNQGKDSVTLDFTSAEGRGALLTLLTRADIVIEAARPRALEQLGISAGALLAADPGKLWITITGHGASGTAADWIGFGDDCGVAGGLSAAMASAGGTMGLVGDAIADPLTGIFAARLGWEAWAAGNGGRLALSMSGVVAEALAVSRRQDSAALDRDLRGWSARAGKPFPAIAMREPQAPLHLRGADNARWLPC